eukprot:scaffold569_cov165-Amphora_coffeaeformis.AAC.6
MIPDSHSGDAGSNPATVFPSVPAPGKGVQLKIACQFNDAWVQVPSDGKIHLEGNHGWCQGLSRK